MLIAEELLLIYLDDETGKGLGASGLAYAFPGALLAELLLREAILLGEKGKVSVSGDIALPDPVLARVLETIREAKRTYKLQSWVSKLSRKQKEIREILLERMIAEGVLAREEGKVLHLFKVVRFPEQDGTQEDEIRARLVDTLIGGSHPDDRTAILVSLLYSVDGLRKVVPKEQYKAAKKRARTISEGEGVGKAIRELIAATNAAVSAAVVAATVASTSGS